MLRVWPILATLKMALIVIIITLTKRFQIPEITVLQFQKLKCTSKLRLKSELRLKFKVHFCCGVALWLESDYFPIGQWH